MTPARPPAAPTKAAAVCIAAPAVDELVTAAGRTVEGAALCPPVVDFVAATATLDSASSSSSLAVDEEALALAVLVALALVTLALTLEASALPNRPLALDAPSNSVDSLRTSTVTSVAAHTR